MVSVWSCWNMLICWRPMIIGRSGPYRRNPLSDFAPNYFRNLGPGALAVSMAASQYHCENSITFTVMIKSGETHSPFIYNDLAGTTKMSHT